MGLKGGEQESRGSALSMQYPIPCFGCTGTLRHPCHPGSNKCHHREYEHVCVRVHGYVHTGLCVCPTRVSVCPLSLCLCPLPPPACRVLPTRVPSPTPCTSFPIDPGRRRPSFPVAGRTRKIGHPPGHPPLVPPWSFRGPSMVPLGSLHGPPPAAAALTRRCRAGGSVPGVQRRSPRSGGRQRPRHARLCSFPCSDAAAPGAAAPGAAAACERGRGGRGAAPPSPRWERARDGAGAGPELPRPRLGPPLPPGTGQEISSRDGNVSGISAAVGTGVRPPPLLPPPGWHYGWDRD